MVAHIVSELPLPLQWALALLIFGGGLVVFAVRRSALRVAGGVAALCGAGGLAASWILSPALIVAPPYAVRIVSPAPGAHVGAPLTLTVRRNPSVRRSGSGNVLSVLPCGHRRRRPGTDRRRLARSRGPPGRPPRRRGRAGVPKPPGVQSPRDVHGDDHRGDGGDSGRSGILLTDERHAHILVVEDDAALREILAGALNLGRLRDVACGPRDHRVADAAQRHHHRHRPARHRTPVRRWMADPRTDGQTIARR